MPQKRLQLGGLPLASPLILAPLAGYTISPLRALCRRLGASLTFTEMVAAAGLARGNPKTYHMLEKLPEEQPLGLQLFGARAEELAQAARIGEKAGFQLVDINLGCPVPKVCRTGAGAALLKQPEQALALLAATVNAVALPVTVKLRLGWDEHDPRLAERWIPRFAEAGAAAVTVHGRTRAQGYGGTADWEAIGRCHASAAGAIPVFGSGDLFTASRCVEVLARGLCDGIHLARGALANPWIFRETTDLLEGRPPSPADPAEILACCQAILDWLVARHATQGGIRAFRSFFCWLIKRREGASRFREAVHAARDLEDLRQLLCLAFAQEERPLTSPPTAP